MDWLSRWNFDPILIAALLGVSLVVAVRLSGYRRGVGLAGAAVLAIAFISPLCALSSGLFMARTVHHVILVAIAAPLAAWAIKRRVGGLALATGVQAAVFWAWHAPTAYAAALSSDVTYWLMQLSVLGSAAWFWLAIKSARAPAAVVALLAAMLAMGLLGALITFAGAPLYAPHLLTTAPWGLTPLEDQQAAGLIMWAPAAAFYLIAALVVLGRWIGPDGRTARTA